MIERWPARAAAQRRNTEVHIKRNVVGAAAQITNCWLVFGFHGRGRIDTHRTSRPWPFLAEPMFVNCFVRIGILHRLRGLNEEFFQRRRRTRAEYFARNRRVVVHVSHGFGREFVAELLRPFGRANHAVFFHVPVANFEGALGALAFFGHFAQRFRECQKHGRTAVGVGCAKRPSVVMAARNYPFVGKFAPRERSHNLVGAHKAFFLFYVQTYFQSRAAFQAISQRQTALPTRWYTFARHAFQYFNGRTPGQGRNGNFVKINVFDVAALYFFGAVERQSGFKRRERVARKIHRQERAALNGEVARLAAFGKSDAFGVTVVGGVGVDNHARRARCLGVFGFVAAKVSAVARQHNFALHRYAHGFELFKIFFAPVVGIHHLGRYVARTRIGVPAWRNERVVGVFVFW